VAEWAINLSEHRLDRGGSRARKVDRLRSLEDDLHGTPRPLDDLLSACGGCHHRHNDNRSRRKDPLHPRTRSSCLDHVVEIHCRTDVPTLRTTTAHATSDETHLGDVLANPHDRRPDPCQYERAGYTFSFELLEAAPDAERSERQLAHALELLQRAGSIADGDGLRERAA
jgi:hypothetical protein